METHAFGFTLRANVPEGQKRFPISQTTEAKMSAKIVLDDQVTFVTDPVSPCAGEEFTVSWQEKNIGDEDSTDYQDIFDMDDQGSGDSKELRCDPLPAGEPAMRSLTFTLPAGDYVMTLVINGQAPLNLGNVIINECP
jgi:hypothetical protein